MSADDTPTMGADFGRQLGGYALLNLLGEGAFGQVWQARDAGGRIVALKVLRPEVMGDADAGRRFEREARLGMQLNHPNVVRVFDAGRIDGRLYLATEFLTGGSVAGLIEGKVGLQVADAVRIFADLMRGLQALAERGLIHRDVKPANLLLDDAGVAKVSDFGLARSTSVDRTRFTADGAIVGSPAYIAPEQISGECEPDIRCDLYAGGIMLFELLTGRTPFGPGTVLEILGRHLDMKPPRARTQRAEVPKALDELIDELLRKSPTKRPATPAEVLARLESMGYAARTPIASPASIPTVTPARGGAPTVMASTLPSNAPGAFPATIPSSGFADVFPATIPNGDAGFPATLQDGPVGSAFPATIQEGSAFPSTMPDGGAFPATMPESAPVPARSPASFAPRNLQPVPQPTLSGEMTLSPPAATGPAIELEPSGAPTFGRAKLVISGPEGTRWLFVYAGQRLTFGRDGVERAGQDVCLRCFPARSMAESSKRISAQHLVVDVGAGRVTATDLGSTSGTCINAERIPAKIAQPVRDLTQIRIADVLDLRVRLGRPPIQALRLRGIGDVLALPPVHIERTGNGPEHAYLLVPGCVALGADGAPASDGPVELISVNGRLWWRTAGASRVEPLAAGMVLILAGGPGGATVTATVTAIDPADHKG